MLHGRVAGGGLELALACDIRVAAEDAVFVLPEVSRGIVPTSGALYWLPRIVGLGRAMEMLLTAELIDARQALRIGPVNHVVPAGPLRECGDALARKIEAHAPSAGPAARWA